MNYRNSLSIAIPAVSGPDSTKATNKIRLLQDSKAQWPYPWLFPPPNAKNRLPFGSVAAPAGATPIEIMEFTVPTGMRFYLVGIIQQFVGAGFIQASGNALWTLDKDTPIGSGNLQGSSIADFTNQPFTLGSFDDGPFPIEDPLVFEAGATIRSKVTTDGSIPQGAPNFFVTVLAGWTVPAE